MNQLGLFGGVAGVGPAPVDDGIRAVAGNVPSLIRLGTSSWTFPGWKGLIYDRAASAGALAESGLAAYAKHPLFRTVGVDRTFYQTVDAATFRGWAGAVPPDFRFLVKACDEALLARFPRGRPRAGEKNPRFLDAGWARDAIVAPWDEGLGDRAGPLLFQFPPQDPRHFGGPGAFAAAVHRFLEALPRPSFGFYAVEIRDPALLTPDLAAALADTGTVPSLVVHPRMPDLRAQWAQFRVGKTGPVVVRWMLGHGLEYEAAREQYAPFDRLVAPDMPTRETIARLVRAMAEAERPVWVVINNKAEGSSPLSVVGLAERVANWGRSDRC